MTKSRDQIWDEWRELVNMQPKEIEEWLQTEESKSVGDSDTSESTGHQSGKRIVEIKRKDKEDMSDGDWDHMAKVVGYIKRHAAQVPDTPKSSNWAYSLKNWGHDPFKPDGAAG